MGKKNPPPPKPPVTPKPDKGPNCSICGQPKGEHSAAQLADCIAQRN
jgi:hypothetical protein